MPTGKNIPLSSLIKNQPVLQGNVTAALFPRDGETQEKAWSFPGAGTDQGDEGMCPRQATRHSAIFINAYVIFKGQ